MVVRRFPLLLVVGVILALRVFAYASPPDPDWISGFWDNGDYDDVVILVTATHGTTDVHVPVAVGVAHVVVATVELTRPPAVRVQPSSARQSRAPPAP